MPIGHVAPGCDEPSRNVPMNGFTHRVRRAGDDAVTDLAQESISAQNGPHAEWCVPSGR